MAKIGDRRGAPSKVEAKPPAITADERSAKEHLLRILFSDVEPVNDGERIVAAFRPLIRDGQMTTAHLAEFKDIDRVLAFIVGAKICDALDAAIENADDPSGIDFVVRRRDNIARLLDELDPEMGRWAYEEEQREKLLLVPDVAKTVVDAIWAGPDRWTIPPNRAPYYGDRAGEHVVINTGNDALAVLTAEQQESALRVVRTLDSDTVQLLLFMLSRCLSAGPSSDGGPRYVDFHVNESLAFRGYKPHHKGGFRAEHKREERDRVARLARIWMPIRADALPGVEEPGSSATTERAKKARAAKKKRTRYTPFLTFEIEVEGDVDSDGPVPLPLFDLPNDERNIPYSFHVALGRWANPILHSARHLRAAFSAIAQYRADRSREERFALRIGMALTFRWNGKRYAQQEWTIRELLDDIKVDKPRDHPIRFREEFERGLQRLIEDGVVSGIPDYEWLSVGAELTGRWFSRWLGSKIVFTAPPQVVAFYRNDHPAPAGLPGGPKPG